MLILFNSRNAAGNQFDELVQSTLTVDDAVERLDKLRTQSLHGLR